MALSATFKADFSSFYDAVDKAETKLKEMSVASDNVGKRLTNMATSFSGQKVISEATLMVKAIGDIENISKLTEKEIARLGATTNEAVEKLKKLGKDVPPNLQAIADKTKQADKATIDWMGSLTKIAGAVGIAFSVDAVVGFVGGLFEAASAIKDMSAQWGVSTKAVQQWTAAAKGSGVEAKTLGNTLQHMTAQMAEGSDLYKASLDNIGLSYEKLRKLPMEEQYKQVIAAIQGVQDETLQLDIAIGILGPNAKQMIGAIRDGFIDAADAQNFMADTTIKRLTDAQAKWKELADNVTIYSADMLSAVMGTTERMTKSWGNFFTFARLAIAVQTRLTGQVEDAVAALTEAEIAYQRSLKPVPKDIALVTNEEAARGKELKTNAQLLEEQRQKEEARRKGLAAATKAVEDAKRAEEAYTRELKKHDDALDALVNSFGGTGGSGAIGKANDYIQALKQAIPIEQMSVKAKLDIHKAMDEAIVSYQAAGQMAPKVMYDIWLATKNATEGVIEFSSRWKNFADIVNTQPINLGAGFNMAPPPELTPWKDAFTNFADTLPAIFGKAMMARGGGMGKVLGEQLAAGIGAAITPAIAAAMKGTAAQNNAAAGLGVGITMQMFSEVFRNIVEARQAAGKFQQALHDMTVDMHADMVGPNSPYEDFEDLEEKANEVGLTFVDVWNPDGVKTFGHHLQERYDELERLRRGGEELFEAFTGAFDDLTVALEDFGGAVPDALQPMIDSLLEIEGLPVDIAAMLGNLAEDPSWQTMQARAKELGVDLAALGPKFQESRIHDIAFGYLRDLEMLAGEGSNVVLVLDGMKDELSKLYQDAQATGVKLPETLRPYMQRLVEMGALVDKNGEKVETLTDDMFADVEDKGLAAIVLILKEIKELLERGLPSAAEKGAAGIQNAFASRKVTIPVEYDYGDGPPTAHPHAAPEYARGTDGFVNFGKGTPVILHGWEAVVPRDAANATVTGGGAATALGGGMMTVIVEADGRQLSRIVAPFIPGEVRRLGLARG